ncbi:unnamed protein product [Symbiodinium pilosum]|uniref:EF-hand domain-containing protein n=1 Tax=Symbiodinium pilosum TaxID=2952 RepID=A0A812U137_SYMPI|nr:unnamed protein product [Symbiodinium pilosum]
MAYAVLSVLFLALGPLALAAAPQKARTSLRQVAHEAHSVANPGALGPPRLFGRSFHDAPVGNGDWVNHKQKIFVIGDMDPTAPMDRLDGEAQHASVTGAKPAAPAGERLPLLEDGTPPMAPDWMPSKKIRQRTFPQQPPRGNSGVGEGGGLDNPAGASPLINMEKRRLIGKPDRLRPKIGPPVVGSLKRELFDDPASNYPLMAPKDRLASGEVEAVATVDRVPAYLSRYLEQRVNLDQRRLAQKRLEEEWERADVNKDGVVSNEEFSLELHDRQGKSADEIERLWQRYHQSEDEFMTKSEFLRLARTGYDLGTISRNDVSTMMTPENMKGLGYWGSGATCPAGAYVTGVQIKKMKALPSPSVDDSGVNALKFQCSDGTKVQTAEGPDGEWSNWTQCPTGQAVYSFRSQGRPPRNGLDNAGIAGLEFSCRAYDLSAVSKLSLANAEAAWSEELRCPPGETVCGAQANLVQALTLSCMHVSMMHYAFEQLLKQGSAALLLQLHTKAKRCCMLMQDASDNMGVADLRMYCISHFNRCTAAFSSAIMALRGCHSPVDCSQICSNAQTGIKLVRTRILETFAGIPDCSVGGPVPDFFQRMGRTHFCLVPRGSSAWTIHLYESFFFGCIPVILSDFLDVPFQNVVDWPALSIKWPEDQVGPELLRYLRSIPLERIAAMKRRLEEAACFFDFHRGWGRRSKAGHHADADADADSEWIEWAADQVALGADCEYVQHGDGRSPRSCRSSCTQQPRCNSVNFHPGSGSADSGDCVLRSCRDPAQPALTGGADGWQVWSMVNQTQLQCSPYYAIFSQLQNRRKNLPLQHGPFWHQ